MITELAFVATPVTDLQKARAFYEGALGLSVTENFKDHWIEYTLPEGTFAITNMEPDWKPSAQGTSVAFEVDDLDATLQSLKDKGVPVVMGPFETPVCHIAIIADPDGNHVTLHHRK